MTVDLAPSRILPQDGALRLGAVHTRKLIGIHLNLLAVRRDRGPTPVHSRDEGLYLEALALWLREETGYQRIRAFGRAGPATMVENSPEPGALLGRLGGAQPRLGCRRRAPADRRRPFRAPPSAA